MQDSKVVAELIQHVICYHKRIIINVKWDFMNLTKPIFWGESSGKHVEYVKFLGSEGGGHASVPSIGETWVRECIKGVASVTECLSLCFGYKCLTQMSLEALYGGLIRKTKEHPVVFQSRTLQFNCSLR